MCYFPHVKKNKEKDIWTFVGELFAKKCIGLQGGYPRAN